MRVCAERLTETVPPEKSLLEDRATHVVAMDWFGSKLVVHFDDAAAAAMYRQRYRALVADGAASASLSGFAACDARGEYVFWTDAGSAFRWSRGRLDAQAIAFLADSVVRRAYFSGHAPFASFHAAALRVDGLAAAIVASSEGGKTTTAIACARRGMEVYSDERCIVIGGLVRPFPRALSIRRGSIELLCRDDVPNDSGIGARLRARLPEAWACAQFEELFGLPAALEPAPLAALFFIEERAERAATRSLSLQAALPRLLAAPLRSNSNGIESVALGLSLLRGAKSYALTLGTPDETAVLIRDAARAALRDPVAPC